MIAPQSSQGNMTKIDDVRKEVKMIKPFTSIRPQRIWWKKARKFTCAAKIHHNNHGKHDQLAKDGHVMVKSRNRSGHRPGRPEVDGPKTEDTEAHQVRGSGPTTVADTGARVQAA